MTSSSTLTSESYASQRKFHGFVARTCDFLLNIEFLWSLGAALFVFLSVLHIVGGGYSWAGLIAAVIPFLARWLRYGYLSRRTPFDLPVGLILAAGLIGIGVSVDRSLSWDVYQTLVVSILCYYSFVSYRHPRILIIATLLSSSVTLIILLPYVWLQESTSLPFFSQLQSWIYPAPESLPSSGTPFASAPCSVTVCADILTVILAGIAIFPGKKVIRITAAILTLLLLGLLVISKCHATWPVIMAGMLFVLVWHNRWFLLSLPAWLGVAYLSLVTWRGLAFSEAYDQIKTNLQGKWDGRWEGIFSMLSENYIIGLGLGMYPAVYSEYGIRGPHAHNAYLQFYSDFGLLGAIALTIAAVIFINMVFKIRHSSSDHPWFGITVGTSAAILVGAIYSLVESSPACIIILENNNYYYAISPLFAILAAVFMVVHRSLMCPDSSP